MPSLSLDTRFQAINFQLKNPTHSQARGRCPRPYGLFAIVILLLSAAGTFAEVDVERAKNLVILDEVGVQNLQIETVTADGQTFEQAVFALGRVEPVPSSRAAVSNLSGGRVIEVKVVPGDIVQSGAELIRVENDQSREPSATSSSTTSLTAPIAGMVTAVNVRQGESFRRTKTLIEITNLREVDIIARVPEHEAALMRPGTRARIRVPAACDINFKSELLRFGTEADRKHGTVEAVFRLPNRELLMRPGMRAELRVVAAERPNVTAVPREAVQGNGTQRFVFVKDYELPHAFVRVPVVTGQRNDRFIEIVRGLMPGDEVVTRGAYALSSAGQGNVSLKAALDAAHGHAHHEDGTPVGESHERHSHKESETSVSRGLTPLTTFFATFSGLLLGLLYLSRFRDRETSA